MKQLIVDFSQQILKPLFKIKFKNPDKSRNQLYIQQEHPRMKWNYKLSQYTMLEWLEHFSLDSDLQQALFPLVKNRFIKTK